jgi:hemolysin III
VRSAFVKARREQSRKEDIANSVSHGVGLVAALLATPYLVSQSAARGEGRFIVGVSIFAASVVLLYLASTLYHGLAPSKAKHIFRLIEHSAIFFLIAGTYTPFTLGVLHGTWGWTLLALIWSLAIVGIVLKVLARMSHPIVSTGLYLLMGWLIVIAIKPLAAGGVPTSGLLLLLAGGLAYTLGVTFYALDARMHYGHLVWHLFVLTGTACHYFAILWYAA